MLNIILNNFFYIKLNSDNLLNVLLKDIINNNYLMIAFISYFNLFIIYNFYNITYYSRNKRFFWFKGEKSKNFEFIKNIYIDCDMDVLILEILQINNLCCHMNLNNCFLNEI